MISRAPRHGNPGAARGEYGSGRSEKTERLSVPVDASTARRARATAHAHGLSLAEWIRWTMRRAWLEDGPPLPPLAVEERRR